MLLMTGERSMARCHDVVNLVMSFINKVSSYSMFPELAP